MKPGIIAGGNVVHDCPSSRSIGYFLEPVVMLAPFAKKPLQLTLRGITTDDNDLSERPGLSLTKYRKESVIHSVWCPRFKLVPFQSCGLERTYLRGAYGGVLYSPG